MTRHRQNLSDLLFRPDNFVPLATAYLISLFAFGLVMLAEPRLVGMGAYSAFGGAHVLWGWLCVGLASAQVASLVFVRKVFWTTAIMGVFLWLWIALSFLLSVGHITTAQAMYIPAAASSAWLALRTAPHTW